MGVTVKSTYEAECDRCKGTQTLDYNPVHEPDREWGFWSRLSEDGHWPTTQRLLCPGCLRKIELFMQGFANPQAQVYNADDEKRYQCAIVRSIMDMSIQAAGNINVGAGELLAYIHGLAQVLEQMIQEQEGTGHATSPLR